VWQSIVRQIDVVDAEDAYVSTTDVSRTSFLNHPWNITGGGATKLQEQIDNSSTTRLVDFTSSIGFASFPGLDDAFVMDRNSLLRKRVSTESIRKFVKGDALRDWRVNCEESALTPYDCQHGLIPLDISASWARHLWTVRSALENVVSFGGQTRKQCGDKWWGWYRWIPEKYRTPLSIAFAFVATHNHFVLDRGGKVFNRSAPIIKLKEDATEEDHLALLGLLNSSTACFWMKQTFHNKGSTVDQHGARQRTDLFEDFFEYTGTGLKRFPVPDQRPIPFAQRLDGSSESYVSTLPEGFTQREKPTAEKLIQAKSSSVEVRGEMIALQEELDRRCYQLYGLLEEDLVYEGEELPKLDLGQRAFEIVMARRMEKGELETSWFQRHGSKPITDIPQYWPEAYRQLVERRIELIQNNKAIGLIEKPEYKRRWNTEPWESQQQRALRNWLLDRLESKRYWPDAARQEPRLRSVAELADQASGDPELMEVGALYRGRQDFDVTALVAELVESESVPVLPVLRYKASGLRKRAVWEQTWDLQRREDAGEEVGDIKVPPKYASKDFRKGGYWRLRGKLDVPKERWVSFPYCETESDPSLVVGWAGWDHLQQATAIVAYYDARKREGWDAKRLTPLLAALDQLLPWIHQWHPEVDPEFGETAGQSFETMLEADAHELGLTLEEIRVWTPLAKKGNHE
ncbi:MAG: BREX-2 system adenine-specific DNA-methyltransferase PglX, partial [bacterium]